MEVRIKEGETAPCVQGVDVLAGGVKGWEAGMVGHLKSSSVGGMEIKS